MFAYTDDAPSLDTGVTTYNRELIKGLCEKYQNHLFSIFLAKKNSAKFADIHFENLNKIIIEDHVNKNINTGWWNKTKKRFSFFLQEVFTRSGFRILPIRNEFYDSIHDIKNHDLVICTVFDAYIDFPLYCARKIKVKCISVLHDIRVFYLQPSSLKNRISILKYRYIVSRLIRESNKSLVPSNYIKFFLSSMYGNEDKICVSFVVPNLSDVCNRPQPSIKVQNILKNRSKFLFYPSTIVETKNHFRLFEAIKLIHREIPDIKLILTGSNTQSPLAIQLFNYALSNRLNENILHLGFVTENEKYLLYKAAVSLVVPSIGESYSLPIWEAFASRCPVIASTDRDIPEQVADAALLCDPNNPSDIAARIKDIWSDEDLRKRLIIKGFLRYEKVRRNSLFTGWESIIQ